MEPEVWVVVVIAGDWSQRWEPRPVFPEWGPGSLIYGPYVEEEAKAAAQRWNETMSSQTGKAFAERVRPDTDLLN